jgi:hypothetical protein
LTGRGDLHLIAEAHVALDHLTRHADVVCDLIDVVMRLFGRSLLRRCA